MEQAEYRNGAATLMQWLGENMPHMQQSARSFSSLSDFHLYMRTVSGVSTEYFDSHGHACLAYLEAMKGRYGTRGVPVETKPAATLGDQLRKVLERDKPSPTPTLYKLENEAEKKEEPQHNGAELIRRWAEKERARMQKERDEMLMPVGPNDAMIARDCTEAACLYAEQRQEAERVRATLSATKSTAKPALAALSRISSMSHMLGNGIKG